MTNRNHLSLAMAADLSVETVRRWASGKHVSHTTDFLLRAKSRELGITPPPSTDARSTDPAVAAPR